MRIELDLETATDEQLKIAHLALHRELQKRGMPFDPRGKLIQGDKETEKPNNYKGIEKL